MKKPKCYLSHPIAGLKGIQGIPDYENELTNCEKAIQWVRWLRGKFPEIDWYCPGEVEIPIQTARKLGYLTMDQVLNIDICILENTCSGILICEWEDSNGINRERKEASRLNYPVLNLNCRNGKELADFEKEIREFVNEVINSYNKNQEVL